MTAGPSYHCQQAIACRHLTVKGFLFERKAHCVSAQVMRLFLYIHEQNTEVPNTIDHCADLTPSSFVTRSRLHASRNLCRCVTHFSFRCVRGTTSIVCAVKTIAPLKISRLIGLIQYSWLKVLPLKSIFLSSSPPLGFRCKIPISGWVHAFQKTSQNPSPYPSLHHSMVLKHSAWFKAHLICVPL